MTKKGLHVSRMVLRRAHESPRRARQRNKKSITGAWRKQVGHVPGVPARTFSTASGSVRHFGHVRRCVLD